MKKIFLSLFLVGCINYIFAIDQVSSENDKTEKKDKIIFAVDTSRVIFHYTGSPDVAFYLSGFDGLKSIGNTASKIFFYEVDKSELGSTYLKIERKIKGLPKEVLAKFSLGELLAKRDNIFQIETELPGQVYTSKYTVAGKISQKQLLGKPIIEFSLQGVIEESPFGRDPKTSL